MDVRVRTVHDDIQELANDLPPLLTPLELAKLLSVSTRTLERWRKAGTGPTPVQMKGSSLNRYVRGDVLRWLIESQIRHN